MNIIMTRTMISVNSVQSQGDYYYINGFLNDANFSVFVLLVKSSRYELVVSPNRMSYDFCSRVFEIKFEKKSLAGMLDDNPELEFYVKKGNNSVKYGQGDDLTHNDIIRMSALLTLAYSMPLVTVESMHVQMHRG